MPISAFEMVDSLDGWRSQSAPGRFSGRKPPVVAPLICRVLLVTEGTDSDDPSVFGQEAHIISEAATGPRHAELPAYDVYDNLILLCSKDHKRVDGPLTSSFVTGSWNGQTGEQGTDD